MCARHPMIAAALGMAAMVLTGCAAAPEAAPATLKVECVPKARVVLNSPSLAGPLLLGTTPILQSTVTVRNAMLPEDLREGEPEEYTTVRMDSLDGVTLELEAERAASLYQKATRSVPPWEHDVNLGFPADVRETKKIGIDLAILEETGRPAEGYTMKIRDQQFPLPRQMELPEGRYIFQLQEPFGRYYSGMLELKNSGDEFVRFAYVPVLQKVTPAELREIGRGQDEPRLYSTSVEGRGVVLADVWLGSRASTEAIALNPDAPKNIEVVFARDDARIRVDSRGTGPRFYVEGGREHMLQIDICGQDQPETATLYGTLKVPPITRVDTMLTSFRIELSDDDIQQVVEQNKVLSKSGLYQPPEDVRQKITMYSLVLGKRRPDGM